MNRYVIIEVDGSIRDVVVKNPLSLQSLQALVGGFIESTVVDIALKKDRQVKQYDAFVNEEGALIPLPVNKAIPRLRGPIILGKVIGSAFLGVDRIKK